MTLEGPPVLETPRLRLRPFERRDLGGLYALHSHPEVMRYSSHVPWTQTSQAEAKLAEILDPARAATARIWLVADRATDLLIGDCVLFSIDRTHARCEVGYSLLPEFQRHGFATEAVLCALAYAFGELGLMRIEADVDPRNERSYRLIEKLGFKREGLLRQRWRVGGEVQDTALYGLLKDELVHPRDPG